MEDDERYASDDDDEACEVPDGQFDKDRDAGGGPAVDHENDCSAPPCCFSDCSAHQLRGDSFVLNTSDNDERIEQ